MYGRIAVYRITNIVTGDFYIGSTVNLSRRIKEHFSKSAKSSIKVLREAIEQFGVDKFLVDVLEDCTLDNVREREAFYITTLNPTYNRTTRTGHIDEHTLELARGRAKKWWSSLDEETKARIIRENLTYRPQRGHSVSQITRAKLREARAKQVFPEESRKKQGRSLSETLKKNPYINIFKSATPVILDDGTMFYQARECADFIGVRPEALSVVKREKRHYCRGYRIYFCGVETNRDECNDVGRKIEHPSEVRGND